MTSPLHASRRLLLQMAALPLASVVPRVSVAANSSSNATPTSVGASPSISVAMSPVVQSSTTVGAVAALGLSGSSGASLLGYSQGGTGAVPRTVEAKLRETISVLDFGADPTGVNDSANGINNAIAAAAAIGTQVYLPPGTYIVASSIVLQKGVDVIGAGPKSTILRGKSGTMMDVVETADFALLSGTNRPSGPYKFSLQNLCIDGNKANRSGGRCMSLYGYDFRIRSVVCMNSPVANAWSEWALSATVPVAAGGDSMEAHWTDFKSYGAVEDGLDFYGPHDSVLSDIHTFNNGGTGCVFGVSANSSGGCVLRGFHSYGNALGAIIASPVEATDVQVESNRSIGGLLVKKGAYFTCSTLQAYSNRGYGVNNAATEFHVSTLRVEGNAGDGLLNTAAGISVANGLFYGNGGYGINGVTSASSFADVFAHKNGEGGIQVTDGASNLYLTGQSSGNTGTQLALNTLGSGNYINLTSYTADGQVGYSGSVGSVDNNVNYVSTGNSAQVLISGAAPSTGWGSPTGVGVVANFSGSTASLSDCSQAIAQIITDLKKFGFYTA